MSRNSQRNTGSHNIILCRTLLSCSRLMQQKWHEDQFATVSLAALRGLQLRFECIKLNLQTPAALTWYEDRIRGREVRSLVFWCWSSMNYDDDLTTWRVPCPTVHNHDATKYFDTKLQGGWEYDTSRITNFGRDPVNSYHIDQDDDIRFPYMWCHFLAGKPWRYFAQWKTSSSGQGDLCNGFQVLWRWLWNQMSDIRIELNYSSCIFNRLRRSSIIASYT